MTDAPDAPDPPDPLPDPPTGTVTYLGHASVLLDLQGVRIITDPVLRGRVRFLRRTTPPPPAGVTAGIDVIALSHLHHDHCDLPSLREFGRDVPILAPPGGDLLLRRHGFREVVVLEPGASYTAGAVTLTATPAVHNGKRTLSSVHGGAIGYLISADGRSVYFAGDTDVFDGMADLGPGLDLALLPVWGWGPNLGPGHMDPVRAAEAVGLLRPRHAVPIHWGTYFPVGLAPFFRDRLREPGPAFAREVAVRRLPARVWVVAPGEEIPWD